MSSRKQTLCCFALENLLAMTTAWGSQRISVHCWATMTYMPARHGTTHIQNRELSIWSGTAQHRKQPPVGSCSLLTHRDACACNELRHAHHRHMHGDSHLPLPVQVHGANACCTCNTLSYHCQVRKKQTDMLCVCVHTAQDASLQHSRHTS